MFIAPFLFYFFRFLNWSKYICVAAFSIFKSHFCLASSLTFGGLGSKCFGDKYADDICFPFFVAIVNVYFLIFLSVRNTFRQPSLFFLLALLTMVIAGFSH